MEDKYITTYAMLRHVISYLGLRNVIDLPTADIIVWMAEASSQIGSYKGLETVSVKVPIVNYTGNFPLDLYCPIRVEEYPDFVSSRNGFTCRLMEGEVTLIYEKLPVDDDGFPMFVNTPATIQAVIWYVAKPLAIQGKLPNGNLSIQYCNQQWQWYCGQARAEGYTPTIDTWNRMVNTFYKLIPQKTAYLNKFAELNLPENLDLDKMNSNRLGSNYTSRSF